MGRVVPAGAALAVITGLVAWSGRGWLLVVVSGHSMSPTFQDGERLLVRRYRGAPIDTGDIVVFAPPAGTDPRTGDPRWRIKRVAATAGEAVPAWLSVEPGAAARVPAGHLVVVGDNATSQDSRHLGFIPVSSVVAVIRRRPSVGASPGASAAR